MSNVRPGHIFIVDDNPSDIYLYTSVFKKVNPQMEFSTASDAGAAILFLNSLTNQRFFPDLIILDFNLRGVSGLDVLKYINTRPILRIIPVVIVSSSSLQNDIFSSYMSGANSFIVKPFDYLGIEAQVKSIYEFWFETCCLATRMI